MFTFVLIFLFLDGYIEFIFNDLEEYLSKYNIQIFKPLINEYITTQDSGGFSISLLNSSEEMRKLWLEPSSVPYFHL